MTLALFSPIFFISSFFEVTFERSRPIYFYIRNLNLNYYETFFWIFLSLGCCYILYVGALYFYRKIHPSNKHPLLAILLLYAFIYGAHSYFRLYHQLGHIHLVLFVVYSYFSSVFVMMAYEFKDDREMIFASPLQRFCMLSTMHTTFYQHTGTQLSPKGLKELFDFGNKEANPHPEVLKLKALRLMLLCLVAKILSVVLGHLFLSIESPLMSQFNISSYELYDLVNFKSVPRYFILNQTSNQSQVYLMIFIRGIHFFAFKYMAFNSKIALLWFMGFPIELAIINPFKASSFVDFFRRTHVYVAHFYKVFIFQYVSLLSGYFSTGLLKKYSTVWLMIFVGGMLFQTVSHNYQLFGYSLEQNYLHFSSRLSYNTILATLIVFSLFLEKKFRPQKNILRIGRGLIYIILYSVVMSISASIKFGKFDGSDIVKYFKFLLGA